MKDGSRKTDAYVFCLRLIFLFWVLAFIFHASQYSLFSLSQLEVFDFLGGLSEAHRLAQSSRYASAANAFGEHIVILFLFFCLVFASLILMMLRQVFSLLSVGSTHWPAWTFFTSVTLAFLVLSFIMFSHDFSIFFGTERRTSGGIFWLKLLLYSVGWPILAVVCIDGLVNPEKYTKK